jgi:2-oxoglutarate ferredoxin oxidoreductase subunit delta
MIANQATTKRDKPEGKHSTYPAWCKRCGNCVAFCPLGILVADEWGYPRLVDQDRCTGCGLCEMLCPDFAITVGYEKPGAVDLAHPEGAVGPSEVKQEQSEAAKDTGKISPERLAPVPREEK